MGDDEREDFIYEMSDSEIKRLLVRWEMRDPATDGVAVYALFEYRREGGRLAGFPFEKLEVEAKCGHMSTTRLPELQQDEVKRTTFVHKEISFARFFRGSS